MKLKISAKSETAEARLNEALDELQKRCSARTISGENILYALEEIEHHLDIPKVQMDGITVCVDLWAQNFPSAYHFTPESTFFCAENHKGKWTITEVYRSYTRRLSQRVVCQLSDSAKEAILKAHSTFWVS